MLKISLLIIGMISLIFILTSGISIVQAIPYIPSLSILWNRDGIDSHWFRLVLRLGLLSWNIKS